MAEESGNSSWGRKESDSEQLSTRHNQKLFLIYKGKKEKVWESFETYNPFSPSLR